MRFCDGLGTFVVGARTEGPSRRKWRYRGRDGRAGWARVLAGEDGGGFEDGSQWHRKNGLGLGLKPLIILISN